MSDTVNNIVYIDMELYALTLVTFALQTLNLLHFENIHLKPHCTTYLRPPYSKKCLPYLPA